MLQHWIKCVPLDFYSGGTRGTGWRFYEHCIPLKINELLFNICCLTWDLFWINTHFRVLKTLMEHQTTKGLYVEISKAFLSDGALRKSIDIQMQDAAKWSA
ncbi:hypothetical protein [Legionella spiritensis]|uniref:hypothetical protein n=1 Tax=Legionella spiritensis TaxID=452 RepID=UPI000F84A14A|nr:hypothetical protein [Legionella spiritensis]